MNDRPQGGSSSTGTDPYAVTARYPAVPRDQAAPPRFGQSPTGSPQAIQPQGGQPQAVSFSAGQPPQARPQLPPTGGGAQPGAAHHYQQPVPGESASRASQGYPGRPPLPKADADPHALPGSGASAGYGTASQLTGAYPAGVTGNYPGRPESTGRHSSGSHASGGYPSGSYTSGSYGTLPGGAAPGTAAPGSVASSPGYAATGAYPAGAASSANGAYPANGGYPASNAYPASNGYPEGGVSPVTGAYPTGGAYPEGRSYPEGTSPGSSPASPAPGAGQAADARYGYGPGAADYADGYPDPRRGGRY